MKWLLALVVVATLGRVAAADEVDERDTIASLCPHAAAWPLVLECFRKHGLRATIFGALDDANLVSVTINDKDAYLEGFALYVHTGTSGSWRIGGVLQQSGNLADFTLLRLEHVATAGYHFDVATSQPSSASLDGVTSVATIYRQVLATFCSGASSSCMELIPKCEQIVRGQTVMAFEGAITVHDHILSLKGAGSVPACSASSDARF